MAPILRSRRTNPVKPTDNYKTKTPRTLGKMVITYPPRFRPKCWIRKNFRAEDIRAEMDVTPDTKDPVNVIQSTNKPYLVQWKDVSFWHNTVKGQCYDTKGKLCAVLQFPNLLLPLRSLTGLPSNVVAIYVDGSREYNNCRKRNVMTLDEAVAASNGYKTRNPYLFQCLYCRITKETGLELYNHVHGIVKGNIDEEAICSKRRKEFIDKSDFKGCPKKNPWGQMVLIDESRSAEDPIPMRYRDQLIQYCGNNKISPTDFA